MVGAVAVGGSCVVLGYVASVGRTGVPDEYGVTRTGDEGWTLVWWGVAAAVVVLAGWLTWRRWRGGRG